MRFRIERLAKQDRSEFDCGTEILNRYLQKYAGQDQRKRYAVCFVAIEDESGKVVGFYTLSSDSIDFDRLPDAIAKRLPRYPVTPIVMMGRLAVDQTAQGSGLARALLVDANQRVSNLEIGAFALAVEAKDDEAVEFYLHHGFTRLESRDGSERMLVLPIVRL